MYDQNSKKSYIRYCVCLVAQLCLTLYDPMECSPPGSSVPGDSPGKHTGVGCHALLQENLLSPRIKPRCLSLLAGSLPSEPQGKPKITGMSSLSLLQGIFPSQELNQGLLHCRRILYQLSYEEALIYFWGKPSYCICRDDDTIYPSIHLLIYLSIHPSTIHWNISKTVRLSFSISGYCLFRDSNA